jgi:heme exporter protein D
MLIVALVLAVIGLAALVTAVVTGNAVVAWVCIGASVIGVVLLIVDAIRERQAGAAEAEQAAQEDAGPGEAIDATYQNFDAEYPDEEPDTQVIADNPDEIDAAENEAASEPPAAEPDQPDENPRPATG